jgi:hypothetical protein
MTYERSIWAEDAGIWHDLNGRPWREVDEPWHGWERWSDTVQDWELFDAGYCGSLLDALVCIIEQLKDERDELAQQ